jgi:YrbI family 3-deoxy-D-manno-octulosonate 8-phosphate phosphatase
LEKVIAFVPARGGSKSIPGKNIKPINGQPLIYWVIQELIVCEEVNEIWVSTDSDEIAACINILKSDKIQVFERSTLNATDLSTTEDAMLEFIDAKGLTEEIFILVQATNPFLKSKDIYEGLSLLNEYDSVLSVVDSKRFFWSKENHEPLNYNYMKRPRRQDFQGLFLENGAFYINSVKNILTYNNRLSGKIGFIEMEEFTGFEIDEPSDWLICDSLLKNNDYTPLFHQKRKIKLLASDVDGVLTDAGMYYSEIGDEQKKFNTRDGKAFQLAREAGLKTAIVTSEKTKIVTNRAKKLKIDYLYQGMAHGDKLDALKGICQKEKISLSDVAYIGDDINCMEALLAVGHAFCPNNAVQEVKNLPGITILSKDGGQGVIRELVSNYILH